MPGSGVGLGCVFDFNLSFDETIKVDKRGFSLIMR